MARAIAEAPNVVYGTFNCLDQKAQDFAKTKGVKDDVTLTESVKTISTFTEKPCGDLQDMGTVLGVKDKATSIKDGFADFNIAAYQFTDASGDRSSQYFGLLVIAVDKSNDKISFIEFFNSAYCADLSLVLARAVGL